MVTMYLKLLLLIISAWSGSSAAGATDGCPGPAFTTQGPKDQQTVIRLNLNNAQLGDEVDNRINTYEWKVHARTTERIGNETVGTCKVHHVPCNLRAWQTARGLRNDLMQVGESPPVKINETNMEIAINNAWIEFGIIYTVEVTIIHLGKAIETKCFDVSTTTEEEGRNNEPTATTTALESPESRNGRDFLELILIGPDRVFCSSAVIINAFVVGNCSNTTFQWKLKESPGAVPEIMNYQGSRLELPEYALKNARTYEITCELIKDNDVITSDTLKVSVRKPKLVIRLQNKNQTVGVNQSIKIIAHVDIPKGIKHEIIWTCTKDTKRCGQFSSTTTLFIRKGFAETGLYEFDLTVTHIDGRESLTVFVEVINCDRSVEFDKIPALVPSSQMLEVTAHMMNVRSGCTLKWQSIHNITQGVIEENYTELDISQTNYNRTLPIYVKRDAFLKELAPFSDKPGEQTITLRIKPELFNSIQDAKYLIRLSTSCDGHAPNYADLEITTNAAPVTTQLKVVPVVGDALLTTFRFETTPAKDKAIDMPLTYYFGWYATNNASGAKEITYFSKLQDFYISETNLPYIKETNGTLHAIMVICDNKDSCSTFEGPNIKVMLPSKISDGNHHTIKEQLRCDLVSNDFDKFTYDMLIIFKTYKHFPHLLGDLQKATNSFLNEKTKYLMDKPHKNSSYALISSLTASDSFFKPSDDVHKNIVKLRGRLVNVKMTAQIVTDDQREALGVINEINEKDLSSIGVEDIQKYFEATEFIITTSDHPDLVNQEKDNFIKNMDKYLSELCVLLFRDPQRPNFKFKLQTAYILLERFSNSYFRNFKFVPSPNNEWETNIQIMLNQSWHMQVRDKSMCIAKAILKGYLGHDGMLYYARLFNNDMSEFKLDEQPNTIMKKSPNSYKCSSYSDGAWNECRTGPARNGHVVCMCNKMGYFRIDNSSRDDGTIGVGGGEGHGTDGNQGNSNNNGDNEIGGSSNPGTIPNPNGTNKNNPPVPGNPGNGQGNSGSDNTTNNSGNSGNGEGSSGSDGNSNGNSSNNGGGTSEGGGNQGSNNGSSTSNIPNMTETTTAVSNINGGNGNNGNSGNGTNNPGGGGGGGGGGEGGGAIDSDEQLVEGGSDGDDINDIETGGNGDANNPGTTPAIPDIQATPNTGQGGQNNNPENGNNSSIVTEDKDSNTNNNNNTNNTGNGSSNNNPREGTNSDGDGSNSNGPGPNNNGSDNSGNNGGSGGTNTNIDNTSSTSIPTSSTQGNNTGTGGNSNNPPDGSNSDGNGSNSSPNNGNGSGNSGNNGGTNNTNDDDTSSTTISSTSLPGNTEGIENTNNSSSGTNSGGNSSNSSSGNNTNTGSNSNPNSQPNNNNGTQNNGGNNDGTNTNNDNTGTVTTAPSTTSGNNSASNGSNSSVGSGDNPGNIGDTTGNASNTSGGSGSGEGNGGGPGNNNTSESGSGNTGSDGDTTGSNTTTESNSVTGNNPGSINNNTSEDSESGTDSPSNTNTNDNPNGNNGPGGQNNNTGNENNNGTTTNTDDTSTTILPTRASQENNAETGSNNNNPHGGSNSAGNETNAGSGNNSIPSNEQGGQNNNPGNGNNGGNGGTNENTSSTTNPATNSGTGNNSNNGGTGGTNQNPLIIIPPGTTSAPGSGNITNANNNGGNPTPSPVVSQITAGVIQIQPVTTPANEIRAAGISSGSFLTLGDQISFAVIGLCVLGTSGLVLFGIISKRVRKSRAAATTQPEFPMYADIFHKENMSGEI